MALCGKPERHITEWMDLAECLWPDPDDMPDCWCEMLRVQVCRLRKALESINSEITIVTHWGAVSAPPVVSMPTTTTTTAN